MQYSPPRNNSLGFALTKKHAQAFSKPAPAAVPEFDEPSFSQMQRPRFDSINAKQYGIMPEHTEWDGDVHYSKPEGSPTSQRSTGPWASDVPAPVTPDPRWGGGNSRADSDESSDHGFTAGSMKRRVAMNLAAAHPEAFADNDNSSLPPHRNSGSGGGGWGGNGIAGGALCSSSTHLGEITEDNGDFDDGSNMYHVAGGGLVSDGGAFGGGMMVQEGGADVGSGGGFAGEQYGQAGLSDHGMLPEGGEAGSFYGGLDDGEAGYQGKHFGSGPVVAGAEASDGLLPLPSLSASSRSPLLNSSAPTAEGNAALHPGGHDLLHAAAAGLAPATRSDGSGDPQLIGATASPPRTGSVRSRARSVHLATGQHSTASPASPTALSPMSASPHHQEVEAHAAKLPSPRLASLSGDMGNARGGSAATDLFEPMDTEALEADLATVLRRLPASTRYGSRDGASELVASGVVQQLYARVTRLQSLLRRRETDAHEADKRSHSLDVQLTEVQAEQSQINAQLMEAMRKLATRDHELFTAQQRVKDAETSARATAGGPPDSNKHVGHEELDRMQRQLQEAKAQLAVRDAELASATKAIADRNQELHDAEAVLRASETELASQLSAAAGRLLPLVNTQHHGTSHADLATAVSKELASLKSELEAQKAQVEAMKAEAAEAMQAAEGERVAKQRLQAASDKLRADAAKARSEAQALEQELEGTRRQQATDRPKEAQFLPSVIPVSPRSSGLPKARTPSQKLAKLRPTAPSIECESMGAGSDAALDSWRRALTKERGDRQKLAGQLEVAQAELQASKSAAQRAQASRLAEAQEMSCRLHHTESQLRDVHRRLTIAEQRLQDAHEETKEQRGSTASKLAELASEKDASRRFKLQVTVHQGAIDTLKRQLKATQADLAATRTQQLTDAMAAQQLSRQVADLQAEVASQMQEAEVEMDRLTRTHMERLHELAAHPWFTITPSGTAGCLSKSDHARLAQTGLLKGLEEEMEEKVDAAAAEGDAAGRRVVQVEHEPPVAWQDGLPLEVAHMQLQQMQEADKEGAAKAVAWDADGDFPKEADAAAYAGLSEASSKGGSVSSIGIRRLSAAMKQAGLHARGGMPGFGEGGGSRALLDVEAEVALPLPEHSNEYAGLGPAREEVAQMGGGPATEEGAPVGVRAAESEDGSSYGPMGAVPAYEAQYEADGHVLGAPAFEAVHEVEDPMPDAGSGVGGTARGSFAFGPGEGVVEYPHRDSGHEVPLDMESGGYELRQCEASEGGVGSESRERVLTL